VSGSHPPHLLLSEVEHKRTLSGGLAVATMPHRQPKPLVHSKFMVEQAALAFAQAVSTEAA
jgi:hypothetical protein